jgi:hypothetical protein
MIWPFPFFHDFYFHFRWVTGMKINIFTPYRHLLNSRSQVVTPILNSTGFLNWLAAEPTK